MLYAYEQDVPIRDDVYRRIKERLGSEPIEGLLSHLVLRRPNGLLRYVDVWASKDACERAFADRIHPAVFDVLSEGGFKPEGEPARREFDPIELVLEGQAP